MDHIVYPKIKVKTFDFECNAVRQLKPILCRWLQPTDTEFSFFIRFPFAKADGKGFFRSQI